MLTLAVHVPPIANFHDCNNQLCVFDRIDNRYWPTRIRQNSEPVSFTQPANEVLLPETQLLQVHAHNLSMVNEQAPFERCER